jgi:hypothetical protein
MLPPKTVTSKRPIMPLTILKFTSDIEKIEYKLK